MLIRACFAYSLSPLLRPLPSLRPRTRQPIASEPEDPFVVLGVSRSSSLAEVRKACTLLSPTMAVLHLPLLQTHHHVG